MQVKTCPKCGFENRPANASCSKCYVDLDGVPLTEGTEAAQPVVASGVTVKMPSQPASPPPAPSSLPPPSMNVTTNVAPPQPPQQPSYTYQGTPPNQSDQIRITIGPPHRKPYALIAIPVVLLLMIAAALVLRGDMKPVKPKVPPDKVVANFLAAKKSGQLVRCKPYLSAASIYQLEHAFASKQERSAGFDEKEVGKMFLFDNHPTPGEIAVCNVKTTIVHDEEVDESLVVVHVSLDPVQKQEEGSFSMVLFTESEFVLVQEGSEWKVDLPMSTKRQGKQGMDNLLNGQLPGMK